MRAKKEAYVVFVGRVPGLYRTWAETNLQVNGYPSAEFRGFDRLADAEKAWADRPAPVPHGEAAPKEPLSPWRLWNLKAGEWASLFVHNYFDDCIAEKCTRVAQADRRVKELARSALVPVREGDTATIERKQASWNARFPQYATTAKP